MYLKIEKEFKKKSKNRKSQLLFVLGVFGYSTILSIVITFFVGLDENIGTYLLIMTGSLIPFFIGCYIVILVKIGKIEKIPFKNIFGVDENKNKYHQIIHEEDIKILSGILKENNINTRPKVQEAIRHYQCLLPRKIVSSGQLLAILAFTISVMALLFSEPIMASIGNVQVVLEIILSVIIIYAAIRIIEKNYFRCFGNNELYVRLEASLSEIFMDYYLKDEEKKTNQAVAEVN